MTQNNHPYQSQPYGRSAPTRYSNQQPVTPAKIKKPIQENDYVDVAETIIVEHQKIYDKKIITTTQIRKLLSMVSELYNQAQLIPNDILPSQMNSQIQYLRMRIAYDAGKEQTVKNFVEQANLINELKRIQDRKQLLLFCHYMEALVAYHRYYIKDDKKG